MKSKVIEKTKKFVKDHKVAVAVIGGAVVGGVTTVVLFKRPEAIQVLPEWALKWRAKCDVEDLLYENGLPIYADADKLTIFKDALSDHADIPELIENGYKIIDRV